MITVAQVTKRFGRVTALDGVTLTIASGEQVAFVGANGSGKTTLLRALLGLVRVEGRVTIGGVDVAREPEIALRSVAYIPQIAPPSTRRSARWCAATRPCAARAKTEPGPGPTGSGSTSPRRGPSGSATCRAA